MAASAIGLQLGASASLSARQAKLFARIDKDGDGQISPDELSAFGQNLPGAKGLSPQELFNKIDTNGDGSISQTEFQAYGQQQAQTRSAMLQAQEQSGTHKHRHHGSGATKLDPNSPFSPLDTNQDGTVSPQEWAAAYGTSNSAIAAGSSQGTSSTGSSNITDTILNTLSTLI